MAIYVSHSRAGYYDFWLARAIDFVLVNMAILLQLVPFNNSSATKKARRRLALMILTIGESASEESLRVVGTAFSTNLEAQP